MRREGSTESNELCQGIPVGSRGLQVRSTTRMHSASGVDEPTSDTLLSDENGDRDAKAQLSRVILNREPLYSEVAKHIMEAKHTHVARAVQPDDAHTNGFSGAEGEATAFFESMFGSASSNAKASSSSSASLSLGALPPATSDVPYGSDSEEKKMFGGGIGGGTVYSNNGSMNSSTATSK